MTYLLTSTGWRSAFKTAKLAAVANWRTGHTGSASYRVHHFQKSALSGTVPSYWTDRRPSDASRVVGRHHTLTAIGTDVVNCGADDDV